MCTVRRLLLSGSSSRDLSRSFPHLHELDGICRGFFFCGALCICSGHRSVCILYVLTEVNNLSPFWTWSPQTSEARDFWTEWDSSTRHSPQCVSEITRQVMQGRGWLDRWRIVGLLFFSVVRCQFFEQAIT